MDYILSMRGRERSRKLRSKFQRPFQRQFWVFLYDLVQIFAFDIGHGDELHTVDLAQVVDTKYVFVRDFAGED